VRDSAGRPSREVKLSTSLRRAQHAPRLYRKHFDDCRKERQLLAASSFFVTFGTVRGITHAIRANVGPFKNITPGGRHIHHMTFGILGLLAVGYLWMMEVGTSEESRTTSRVTSVAYGIGAALTLDEFALWLNLSDDYWTAQGRESIDAVVLFGALLAAGLISQEFVRELVGKAFVTGHRADPRLPPNLRVIRRASPWS
jgi:hypothetical protein